jgi:nicotinamide mononucleotide transporter
MPDSLMARLWSGLLATSPLEALAVLSGIVYVVLAVPRSRWCWIAGGFSSLIYVWLSARARLPMQSLLQAWYVGVAVYGFLRWSREVTRGVSLLSWRGHVAGIAASLLLATAIARFLATETQAAWPHLDALTTMLSLLASSPPVPNSRAGYTGSSSIRCWLGCTPFRGWFSRRFCSWSIS